MSVDVETDLGTLRLCKRDEVDVWLLWCPTCDDWMGALSDNQFNGRVSVDHAASGCASGYHETHNFAVEVVAKIQAHRLMGGYGDDPVSRHASEQPGSSQEAPKSMSITREGPS